jgi:hypothetical protein
MKDSASVNPNPYTIRQTTALHALSSGFSVTEAAEAAGVHRSQVYRWLDIPAFDHAFQNAKREHALAIGYRFHTLAHKALDALEQILTDEKTSPHARIRAAKLVFEKMQQGQPKLKPAWDEMVQIDQQCKDADSPHIVVGRYPYDPSACDMYYQQPQATESESATECDAKPELAKAAGATASAEPPATECDKVEAPAQQVPSTATPVTSIRSGHAPEASATLCDTFSEVASPSLNRSGGAACASAARNA